jgi:adenine deaminase
MTEIGIPLDLLLRNARVCDVFRGRGFRGWAGVHAGGFVCVEEGEPPPGLPAAADRDLGGRWIVPGLIDAHMHIESSLMTPAGFARAAVPHGTTTVLADPHEVANVAGEAGVRWMIRASEGLPLRIYTAIPSCVPATGPELEWTAAVFNAGVVERLAREPSVIALGEVMDYRAVLAGSPRLRGMVEAARAAGLMVEGHIPTLTGVELSRYLAWGITSDHTLTTPEKLREQTAKGLAVMIQAKSCTPENMAAVAALADRSRILLVTDDTEPALLRTGHLSGILRQAIEAGMPPHEAVAAATIRPARYLGLRDLGAVAPGFRADFLVMEELSAFPPGEVYVGGRRVAAEGRMLAEIPGTPPPPGGHPLPGPFAPEDFRLAGPEMTGRVTANAVTLCSTTTSLTDLARVPVEVEQGHLRFVLGDGLALCAVVARNGVTRSVGVVRELGLREGAYASSFAHDSHNLLVCGRDPAEMSAAANAVRGIEGGVIVVARGKTRTALPLPILGLLSDAPLEGIVADSEGVDRALHDLGVRHRRPFLMLSLLALTVSPRFKFSDKGVVDTERRRLLPVWEAGA